MLVAARESNDLLESGRQSGPIAHDLHELGADSSSIGFDHTSAVLSASANDVHKLDHAAAHVRHLLDADAAAANDATARVLGHPVLFGERVRRVHNDALDLDLGASHVHTLTSNEHHALGAAFARRVLVGARRLVLEVDARVCSSLKLNTRATREELNMTKRNT